MTLSTYRHSPECKEIKDTFYTLDKKKYLVVEKPAENNRVDLYVGRLKSKSDYKFNAGPSRSKIRILGVHESQRVKKAILKEFDKRRGHENLSVGNFHFIGTGRKYSPHGNSDINWLENQEDILI